MLGSIDHIHIAAIIDALVCSDASALLGIVDELVIQSRNLESVLDELAECMHRMALIHVAPGFRDPERADWDSLVERAAQVSPEDVQLYYQIAITGRRDLGLAPDPRTGLEMTLLRMLAFRPADSAAGARVPDAQPRVTGADASGTSAAPGNPAATEKTASGGNHAAKAARAAFDALHQSKAVKSLKPIEPELEHKAGTESNTADSPASPEPVEDWPALQDSLDLRGATREFARNLQLESTDEKRWKFLVPHTLRHLGSKSVVQNLQSALSSRLGHAVMLDLHTASEPVESVATATQRAEVNLMSEAECSIDDDPTVQEIKEKFGAKIIPDSIQPLQ